MPHQWTTSERTDEILTEPVVKAANRGLHGDYEGTPDALLKAMAEDLALLGGAVALLLVERDKVKS